MTCPVGQALEIPRSAGGLPPMGLCDSSEWPEGPNKTDAGPEFPSCSSKKQVNIKGRTFLHESFRARISERRHLSTCREECGRG